MKFVGRIVLIGGMMALATLTTTPAPATAQSHPCAGDIATFCAGVPVGGGRIRRCLKSHEADLSAACRDKLDVKMASLAERHHACATDASTLCAGVKPGAGRIRHCLHLHHAQLSTECASTFATP